MEIVFESLKRGVPELQSGTKSTGFSETLLGLSLLGLIDDLHNAVTLGNAYGMTSLSDFDQMFPEQLRMLAAQLMSKVDTQSRKILRDEICHRAAHS